MLSALISLFAQESLTVTSVTSHNIYNVYDYNSTLALTADDTVQVPNPFSKGAIDDVITIYTSATCTDTMSIILYREELGTDGVWFNKTQVGTITANTASTVNSTITDTLTSKYLGVRYIYDGQATNDATVTYQGRIVTERVSSVKLE